MPWPTSQAKLIESAKQGARKSCAPVYFGVSLCWPPRHRLRFWKPNNSERDMDFAEVVRGLLAGDFSCLAPLFEAPPDRSPAPIVSWHERGLFTDEPKALDEAFSCACFNGCTQVAEYF